MKKPICRRAILLEGPDGSGKSTTAKRLSDYFGWPLVHAGGPIGSPEELRDRVQGLGLCPHEVVFDRHPAVSELVYPEIMGRPSYISLSESRSLLGTLRPVTIFCFLDSFDRMYSYVSDGKKTHKPKEFLAKVKANHKTVCQKYVEVSSLLMSEASFIYNWESDSFHKYLIPNIKRRIECVD